MIAGPGRLLLRTGAFCSAVPRLFVESYQLCKLCRELGTRAKVSAVFPHLGMQILEIGTITVQSSDSGLDGEVLVEIGGAGHVARTLLRDQEGAFEAVASYGRGS